MKRLEEITYEAGRHALADQESLVAGIRQRTGTLLAAHALVASFLGATTISTTELDGLGWVALVALTTGLILAAIVLAPWNLKFALNAPEVYGALSDRAVTEAQTGSLGWLASVGYSYQSIREKNAPRVRWMSRLSGRSRRCWSSRRCVGSSTSFARLEPWFRSPSRLARSSHCRPRSAFPSASSAA